MDTMGGVCHAEASSAFGVNPLSDVARPAGRRAPSLWSSPTLCPQGDHKVSRLHRTSPPARVTIFAQAPQCQCALVLILGRTPPLCPGLPCPGRALAESSRLHLVPRHGAHERPHVTGAARTGPARQGPRAGDADAHGESGTAPRSAHRPARCAPTSALPQGWDWGRS